jgi:hypothetical protein
MKTRRCLAFVTPRDRADMRLFDPADIGGVGDRSGLQGLPGDRGGWRDEQPDKPNTILTKK